MSTYHKFRTVKLHYGKYLYKLQLHNLLAHIFRTDFQRGGKLSYAKDNLNTYNAMLESGNVVKRSRWTTSIIPNTHLDDANTIYKKLRFGKDYLVRVENNTLILYSNNKKFLTNIADNLKIQPVDFWEPDESISSYLKNNEKVIIVDKPTDYMYKVTFGRKRAKPELATWLDANTDKSKAGRIFKENCKNNTYINGQYVYLRDDKVLFLLNMIAGDNVTRVEKLVYRYDIDS